MAILILVTVTLIVLFTLAAVVGTSYWIDRNAGQRDR
jgi:hypothetical protein